MLTKVNVLDIGAMKNNVDEYRRVSLSARAFAVYMYTLYVTVSVRSNSHTKPVRTTAYWYPHAHPSHDTKLYLRTVLVSLPAWDLGTR